jgi:hypothetical protein
MSDVGAVINSVPSHGATRINISILAFLGFATLQTWLIFTHSPWFDEAQALLIARAPWSDLLANIKYEGHPALWYLVLGAIDRLLGASPLSLPVAQLAIALPILALIWFRSPFRLSAKFLLSLSYYLMFEYGVISRDYSLGTLFLLAAVALRRSIWGWICLALAANTVATFTLGAVALGGVFFFQRRSWFGAALLTVGCLVAVATIYPIAPDLHPSGMPNPNHLLGAIFAIHGLSAALVPNIPSVPYEWLIILPYWPGFIVGLLIPLLGALALRDRLLIVGFLIMWGGVLLLGMFTYPLSPRHVGVLFIYLVAGLWMQCEETGNRLPIAAWLWLGIGAACGLPFVATSYMRPFTPAVEVANWMRTHGLENEIWGSWVGVAGIPITAETGVPTLNVQKGCTNTFLRWDYDHTDFTRVVERIRAAGVRYMISDRDLPEGQLLASFPRGGGWGGGVWLYRFDVTPQPMRPCR